MELALGFADFSKPEKNKFKNDVIISWKSFI